MKQPYLYFQGESLQQLAAQLQAADLSTARLEIRLYGRQKRQQPIPAHTKATLVVRGGTPAAAVAGEAVAADEPVEINDSHVCPPQCPAPG